MSRQGLLQDNVGGIVGTQVLYRNLIVKSVTGVGANGVFHFGQVQIVGPGDHARLFGRAVIVGQQVIFVAVDADGVDHLGHVGGQRRVNTHMEINVIAHTRIQRAAHQVVVGSCATHLAPASGLTTRWAGVGGVERQRFAEDDASGRGRALATVAVANGVGDDPPFGHVLHTEVVHGLDHSQGVWAVLRVGQRADHRTAQRARADVVILDHPQIRQIPAGDGEGEDVIRRVEVRPGCAVVTDLHHIGE